MPLVENKVPDPNRDLIGAALTKDATNRAARTAYVQLAIDVMVAVAMLVTTTVTTADGWDSFNWKVLGFSLAKTVVSTVGSFILRRFIDTSSIPTPLPPAPVPAPNEDVPDPVDPDNPDEAGADIPEKELTLETWEDSSEYDGTLPEELDNPNDGDEEKDFVEVEQSTDQGSSRSLQSGGLHEFETPERSLEDKEGL